MKEPSAIRPMLLRHSRGWSPLTVVLTSLVFASSVIGQPAPDDNGQTRPGHVRLNLQGNIKLQALIDLVGKRLGWKFIYDAQIAEREINVKAPGEVPVDTLPALMSSVLRMENLAVVDADVPGWKRIIDAGSMVGFAEPGDAREALAASGPAAPVTQAFVIKHLDVTNVVSIIRPFLTKKGSNVLPVPGSNVLVVTDFAPAILTVERLINLIDQPPGAVVYEVYTVENTTSGTLATKVQAMLGDAEQSPTIGSAARAGGGSANVGLFDEPRTNQVVVIGTQPLVEKALGLLRKFDVLFRTDDGGLSLAVRESRTDRHDRARFCSTP